MLPIGRRQHLVASSHLHRLGHENYRPLHPLDMVVLRLRLGNSNFFVPFIVTKNLAATMIIETEFLDLHVRSIYCMEASVETTRGTVRILSRNKQTVEEGDVDVDTPKQIINTPPDPTNESSSRSENRSSQTILDAPLNRVPVLFLFHLPFHVHTDSKHVVFVNRCLKQ